MNLLEFLVVKSRIYVKKMCAQVPTVKPQDSMNKCLRVLSKLAIGSTELVNLSVFSIRIVYDTNIVYFN